MLERFLRRLTGSESNGQSSPIGAPNSSLRERQAADLDGQIRQGWKLYWSRGVQRPVYLLEQLDVLERQRSQLEASGEAVPNSVRRDQISPSPNRLVLAESSHS